MFATYLLAVPLSLSLAHYAGFKIHPHSKKSVEILHSFAAGFSIAYVFLILLPEINRLSKDDEFFSMGLALVGFALFHAALKLAFRNTDVKRRQSMIDGIHLATLAVYSFLISFFLVELTIERLKHGIFTLIIILIHTVLSDINQYTMHKSESNTLKIPIVISATLLGGILPFMGFVNRTLEVALFALTAGAIIYISVREEIPTNSSGKPAFFLIGVFMLMTSYYLVY